MSNYESMDVTVENVNNLSHDYIQYLINHTHDWDNYEKITYVLTYTKKYNQLFLHEIIHNKNSTILGLYIEANRGYDAINDQLLQIVIDKNDIVLAFEWAYYIGTHADAMLNILLNNSDNDFCILMYSLWISHDLYNPNKLKYKIIDMNCVDDVIRHLEARTKDGYAKAAHKFYSTLPDYTQLNIII